MANIFNKEVIEDFSKPMSEEVASEVLSWTEEMLKEAIEEIRKTTTVITDSYEFELAGDFITDTTTINSEIDLYIALKSPQLELNSIKLSNDKFKQFWLRIKRAWRATREEKMSKRRRKKYQEKMQQEIIIAPNKYSITDFKMSLLKKIIKKIDDKSYIIITPTGLKLIAREFLGVDVNIYPIIKSNDAYKIYNEYSGKFIDYTFDDLNENFEQKIEIVGETFNKLIRVYKNIYFNLFNYQPSQFFIESLIYNIPDSLFYGYDFYEVFIKSLNYLKNAKLEKFTLITNKNQSLFASKEISENILTVSNMIKQINTML